MTYFILLSICIVLILISGMIYGAMRKRNRIFIGVLICLALYVGGVLLLYGLDNGSIEVETAELVNVSNTKAYVAFQLNTEILIRSGSRYRDADKVYLCEDRKFINNEFEVKVHHLTNMYGFHISSEVKYEIVKKDNLKKEK